MELEIWKDFFENLFERRKLNESLRLVWKRCLKNWKDVNLSPFLYIHSCISFNKNLRNERTLWFLTTCSFLMFSGIFFPNFARTEKWLWRYQFENEFRVRSLISQKLILLTNSETDETSSICNFFGFLFFSESSDSAIDTTCIFWTPFRLSVFLEFIEILGIGSELSIFFTVHKENCVLLRKFIFLRFFFPFFSSFLWLLFFLLTACQIVFLFFCDNFFFSFEFLDFVSLCR